MTSRLWARLKTTEALFEVNVTGGNVWTDDAIGSWSTSRGSDALGVQPSTAAAVVEGSIVPVKDPLLAITLTDAGAALLAALTGRPDADLRSRWVGRFAGSTVQDSPHRATALHAADYLALAAAVDRNVPAFTDATRNLPALYERGMAELGLPPGAFSGTVTADPVDRATAWDAVRTNADRKWSEVVDKYAAQAGVVLHTTRAGAIRARNMLALNGSAYRWDLQGHQVLTRHHCTSPAAWESVLNPAKHVRGTLWRSSTSSTEVYPSSSKLPALSRAYTTEDLDLTHLSSRTQALYYFLDGLWQAANDSEYHVPEVTVDVLRLLSSPRADERAMAGQLLTLESWDTVALAYDWPEEVRGTYYAATITESVTPSTWTITLGLLPSLHVVGQDYQHIGDTWATSYPDTTAWETPVTTTWATAP